MAKAKTKRSVMETIAELTDNGWQFRTEEFRWVWKEGFVGMNTGMVSQHGKETMLLYCKSLDHAVMYAWGFTLGFNQGGQAERSDRPETDVIRPART